MHNYQQHLKSNNNISKLAVIVLSIVLLTGISLVPTLQIGVNGQVQQPLQQNKIGLSQVIKQIAQQVANGTGGQQAQILQTLQQIALQTSNTEGGGVNLLISLNARKEYGQLYIAI
jgi:hypothetical protein